MTLSSLNAAFNLTPDDAADVLRRWHSLTPRERDVATLIAEGLMGKEIKRRLGISRRTEGTFRARILAKLGCRGVGVGRVCWYVRARQATRMRKREAAR